MSNNHYGRGAHPLSLARRQSRTRLSHSPDSTSSDTLAHSRASSPSLRRPPHFTSSSLASSFKRARTSSPSASSEHTPAADISDTDTDGGESNSCVMTSAEDTATTAAPAHAPIADLRLEDGTAAGPAPAASPTQLALIQQLAKQPLQVGHYWYPIPQSWYQAWNTACTNDQQQVTPLDCSELAQSSTALKPGLQEDQHYVILPEQAFRLLTSWCGSRGPSFKRQVVSVNGAQPILELYVPQVAFPRISSAQVDTALSPPVSISRSTSLADVKAAAMRVLDIPDPATNVRLWSVPPTLQPQAYIPLTDVVQGAASGEYQAIADDRMSGPLEPLIDRPIDEALPIAVEVKDTTNGTWPTESAPTSSAKGVFAQPEGDYWAKLQKAAPVAPTPSTSTATSAPTPAAPTTRVTRSQKSPPTKTRGLKGLANLGNTCFMNSAIQCLSNTPELKDYFVSRVFEHEINEDNPLGNHGALANAFGTLIQALWSAQGSSHVPRDFKWALSRFAPQFSGYSQQDTQELLAFLLDGLHEDLNRIKKKPYIEAPDWEGGGLEEMVRFAKRQWEIYKMRNDSVIVDLFQGQYRSTLVCPVCEKVSIKFDPFMYLTLPLPNMSLWRHSLIFVPFDPQQPMQRVHLALPAETSIGKLKQTLADMFDAEPSRLFAAELYHRKIWRFYADYEPVNTIETADHALIWELPFEMPAVKSAPSNSRYYSSNSSPVSKAPAVEERIGAAPAPGWQEDERLVIPVYTHELGGRSALGIPFCVALEKHEFNDIAKIRRAVALQYARFVERHDELMDKVDAFERRQQQRLANASGGGEWEVVDPSAALAAGSSTPPSDDVVTEIRVDGDIVESSERRPSSDGPREGGTRPPPVVQMLSDDGQALDGDGDGEGSLPFSLHFMVNTSPTRPILKDAESWHHLSEELYHRAERLANTQPRDGQDRLPLVYRGGALVCVWSQDAALQSIPHCSDEGQWGTNIVDVDDARVAAEKQQQQAGGGGGKRKGKKQLSIEDCLDEFTKEEQLGEEDPWYCPDCKEFRQATKKFDLWKVPDILVVHLKRFSAGRGLRDKIDAVVDFPLEGFDLSDRVMGAKAVHELKAEGKLEDLSSSLVLDSVTGSATPSSLSSASHGDPSAQDLSASILSAISEANDDAVASDKPIYDLFAVDNHYGGLGGGHYTASAKNADDGKWYYFDDSHVRPLGSGEEVKGSAAYLLFYRRRTTRPIGGKSREIVKTHVASQGAGAGDDHEEEQEGDETMKGTATSGGSESSDESTEEHLLRNRLIRRPNRRGLHDSDDEDGGQGGTTYRAFPPSPPSINWSPPTRRPDSSPDAATDDDAAMPMPGSFTPGVQTYGFSSSAAEKEATQWDSPMRTTGGTNTPPPPYVAGPVISPDATVETIPLDEADLERHTKEHQHYYNSVAHYAAAPPSPPSDDSSDGGGPGWRNFGNGDDDDDEDDRRRRTRSWSPTGADAPDSPRSDLDD